VKRSLAIKKSPILNLWVNSGNVCKTLMSNCSVVLVGFDTITILWKKPSWRMKNNSYYFGKKVKKVQVALVRYGLFICNFTYMWSRNDLFSRTYSLIISHPWSFYMRIHYMRVYFWSPYLSHITRSNCIRKTTKGICTRGKVISPPDQMWMEFQLFFSQSAPNINQFLRTSSFANRDEKMFT